MDIDKISELSDTAPVDEEAIKDIEKSLETLPEVIKTSKLEEFKILQQSAAEGGPSSVAEAITILMNDAKMGVRSMAVAIGVKRRVLQRMLSGEDDMSPEIVGRCDEVLRKRAPHIYKKGM